MLRTLFSKHSNKHDNSYLVADIGGTKSRFAIAKVKADGSVTLLATHERNSKEIKNFTDTMKEALALFETENQKIPDFAALAIAGVVEPDAKEVKPTNLDFVIDSNEIIQATGLKNILLLNDFHATGLGVDQLPPEEVVCVHGVCRAISPQQTRAIVGAGTGLGRSLLAWDERNSHYMTLPSEGGHGDFPTLTDEDRALATFVHQTLEWEDVLSGKGLSLIYRWLSKSEQVLTPEEIMRSDEEHAAKTRNLFSAYYGRCVKNVILETLPYGGVFLAGGIAANNISLFRSEQFRSELVNSRTMHTLLSNVPLYVITNTQVNLYGAAQAVHRSL